MCGIFGARWSWLARSVPDPAAAAAAALARLRWRGADGSRLVRVGDFVLGCARLAISGPNRPQPVVRRGGRAAGVLNGALTNARALWPAVLPRLPRRAQLPNDAWLPLALVAGGAAAQLWALAGHYAAAVVDADGDRLVVARDAAGEKPLFVVCEHDRPVAFASTVPALRALGVGVTLPDGAVRRFFVHGSCGAPEASGPGQRLLAGLDGVLEARGAAPLRHLAAPAPAPAAGGLAGALARAVRACLDVPQPAALSLSGGIDSSCLAAVLAAEGRRLPAYQFRAAGAPAGERQLAAAVAGRCGLELRAVDGGPEVLDALPELTAAWGLPLGDPSLLAVHALAKAAARDGIRVLLSGEGADELLLGYDRHRALRVLPRKGPGLRARGWSMARGARLVRAALARDPYAALLQVTPPAFVRQVLAGRLQAAGGEELPGGAGAFDRFERARAIDRAFYLRWDLLPKLDVATMAAGVEGRCPFLDPGVVAAAMAIPARAALGKAPLRRLFAAALPPAVLQQQKRGFALPLDLWFRGPLPWLDLLREPRTRARPHLRARGLDLAIDRHRRGAADLGHALYLVVAFELHLRAAEALPCA